MKKKRNHNLSKVLKYTYNHKKANTNVSAFFVATRRGIIDQLGTKL